jgi:outer membrane protein assembly factor BamB
MRCIATLLLIFPLAASAQAGDNWPDYRGPSFDGHVDAPKLPVEWSEDRNITWKTRIHGRGHSTPVIFGEQIWLTTATPDGHKLYVLCLDKKTGRILRDIKLWDVAEPAFAHSLNSYASPSPVIEAGRVYVHFGTYGTACLDTKTARVIWERRDINCKHLMGAGSSPIFFKDLLIFHVDGADVQYVIALNKQTGETVWKTDRSIDYNGEGIIKDKQKAFSTPAIRKVGDHLELVSVGPQGVWGYDPRTGKELWKLRFVGYSNVTRPVFIDNLAIINTAFDRAQIMAVKLGGKGTLGDEHVAWKEMRNIGKKPTPIIVDGLIYNMTDTGIAMCLDARTGQRIWRERIDGNYSASPIHANGRIYFCNQEGMTTVVKAGHDFKVLAENQLDEGFMASPAVVGNALFLRSNTHLYRIENQAKAASRP